MEAIRRYFLPVVRLFLGLLLIASVFLIVANATGRYVFLAPIIWAEEVLGYVLVWTVYLGSVLVTWDGGHLKMDLLSRTLPGISRTIVNGISVSVFIFIGGLIVYQSWFAIADLTHVSQVAEIPMNWMHSIIPISFVFVLGCILIRFRENLAGTLESEADQIEALREAAATAEQAAQQASKD
ncbi:MAG: TRAP transporter small permease subunit [Alphaproteobacteria bacterium]|nr:TRAP transporter small permease subunit [Alphaproteobacteria bacterium]